MRAYSFYEKGLLMYPGGAAHTGIDLKTALNFFLLIFVVVLDMPVSGPQLPGRITDY